MAGSLTALRAASKRTLVIAALAAVAAMAAVTAVAFAYHGAENAVRDAYQKLYVGLGYHGIVRASTWDYNVQPSVCAKAGNQDGTHKDGGGCNMNTHKRESSFTATPGSAGYGYFGNAAGTSSRIYVYECGQADIAWCDI